MTVSRCFMELNGRPFNLSFYSSEEDNVASSDSYQVRESPGRPCLLPCQVRWRTGSHYEVERFTLLYRKVGTGGGAGDWTTVKIPGTSHHQTVQEDSWRLTNLSSSSKYECIIQVRSPHTSLHIIRSYIRYLPSSNDFCSACFSFLSQPEVTVN